MKEIIISQNEAGKRLDKFLVNFLSNAESGFIFKMLRKKNIVLNDKKCTGKEKLSVGDNIKIYFSDDTFNKFVNPFYLKDDKFSSNKSVSNNIKNIASKDNEFSTAFNKIGNMDVIYEDKNIMLINKKAGILSQKASASDYSLNEWFIGYLLNNNEIDIKSLASFKPSICNRLDRNTSGMVICGKSLQGSTIMNKMLKDRTLGKYY
nr:RluA family pseudouridine synthase [Butyrivibrio sp.]